MRKYYSLIDKVYALKNLYASFESVKRNKGAAGVDHQSIADFEANLVENINQLHEYLRTKTFQPSPVRRVEIPRPDGRKRPLGIPNVRDRVVQQAILNVIQPICEPDFHPSSYGYRPRRSCQHAVAIAQQFLVRYDLPWALDMDLSKCFDTLDHELITRIIRSRVRDPYTRFCERDDAGFDHPASPYSILPRDFICYCTTMLYKMYLTTYGSSGHCTDER